jgi:hypothetical protein
MKVRELIEILKTLEQDAEIDIDNHTGSGFPNTIKDSNLWEQTQNDKNSIEFYVITHGN